MAAINYWLIIPAAGSGQRMASECPKQYLTIAHKPILQHTIDACLEVTQIAQIVVVIAENDAYWQKLPIVKYPRIRTCTGAQQRHLSVLQGLSALAGHASEDDWVLVHDAARCGIKAADILHLIAQVADHPVGGILALPINDTVKRADRAENIVETLDRQKLWLAQTPQMFRYGLLNRALSAAKKVGDCPTDEAQAIEKQGHQAMLVMGGRHNIKVTDPSDLALMAHYLRAEK